MSEAATGETSTEDGLAEMVDEVVEAVLGGTTTTTVDVEQSVSVVDALFSISVTESVRVTPTAAAGLLAHLEWVRPKPRQRSQRLAERLTTSCL